MTKDDERKGLLIGSYRLERKLGEGGMGSVWLAEHRRLRSRFAMKLAYGMRDSGERVQLKTEAERMKALDDRRIPYLVDYLDEEDFAALVMEYVDGITLEEYIRGAAPMEEEHVLSIMKGLCSIVAFLHDCRPQILYRDIKPSNFMISESGELRLLDFGTALTDEGRLKGSAGAGTPGYAPPEQLKGMSLRADADVYALGAVWSYMLTGQDPSRPPFHPLKGAECGRMVGRGSKKLLDECLSADPDKRPADASVLLEELDKIRPGKEAFLSRLEDHAYRLSLILSLLCSCVLLFGRYNGRASEEAELILLCIDLLVLLWCILRDSLYTGGSFILARSWNRIYTEKRGHGLPK